MPTVSPWPIRRQPFEGELFSSWLVRSIRALHAYPHTLCKTVWPEVSFWNRDVDRCVPDSVLEELAGYSETPYWVARTTTLRWHLPMIADAPSKHGIAPWLLPVGVYHRLRTRHGQQYCPACLSLDADPHLRLNWRFAFWFMCLDHNCLLRDSCTCGAPIIAHRSPGLDLRCCFRCGLSLTAASPKASELQTSVQRRLAQIAERPTTRLGSQDLSRVQVFSGIRLLMIAIANTSAGRRMAQSLNLQRESNACKFAGAPELLRVQSRANALTAVTSLLEDWPSRFLDSCAISGAHYRSIAVHRARVPAWIDSALCRLPRIVRAQSLDYRMRPRRRSQRRSWAKALRRVIQSGGLDDFVADRLGKVT